MNTLWNELNYYWIIFGYAIFGGFDFYVTDIIHQ